MVDRITTGNLQAKIKRINGLLSELGVDIDGSLAGAYGGVQFQGFDGSHNYSQGFITKRELYHQLYTLESVLFEVSRQVRAIQNTYAQAISLSHLHKCEVN